MRRLVHFICLSMATAAAIHAEEPDSSRLAGPYLGQDLPDDIPVLFACGVVSTGKEHSAAMFTPDGNEVWFGRMFSQKIYYMERLGDR